MTAVRRRIRLVVAAAAAVPVLLVVALGAFILFFDWNVARGQVGRFVGARVGRPVAIDGDLSIRWGRVTWIDAGDVRLGNPDWASEPDLLSVRKLSLAVDLPALLRLRVVLPELRLSAPKLLLERGPEGVGNWQFNRAAQAITPESRATLPNVGRLAIDDGALTYRDRRRGLEIAAKTATIRGTSDENADQLELCGEGKLQEQRFKFCLRGASVMELQNSTKPYPLDFTLDSGATAVRATGTARDPISLAGLDMAMRVSGPNVAQLLQLIAVPAPNTSPYRVEGQLKKDGDVWNFGGFSGRIGASDIAGDLGFDAGEERLRVTGALRSKRLDIADIGPLIGLPPTPRKSEPPLKTDAQVKAEQAADPNRRIQLRPKTGGASPAPREADRVLPDATLRVEEVRAVDAKVTYRAAALNAPGLAVDRLAVDVALDHGVLRLAPLRLGIAGGRLDGEVTIDARRDPVRTRYDLALSKFQLERLLADVGAAGAATGTLRARVKMTGEGNSVRRSLATANGDAAIVVSGGEVSLLAVELVGLDVFEGLGIALSDKKKTTPLRCAIADLKIENGVAAPRSLVVDTGDTRIGGEGQVDLGEEALDLRIVPHPKDPSLVSLRTPLLVKGTLRHPTVMPEPGPIAARAGVAAALGVLLTPFAAILAFIDPGGGEDADCAGLEAAAEQRAAPPRN